MLLYTYSLIGELKGCMYVASEMNIEGKGQYRKVIASIWLSYQYADTVEIEKSKDIE